MQIPRIGERLSSEHIDFLSAFSKSCRRSIIEMVRNSNSGHPGGSLSTIDFLTILYTFIISQTGENLIVSNGHISPGVYSVLGEMRYVSKDDAINTFRKAGSKFEGHVTRHVDGVVYGTGPLGTGISAASGFAVAEKVLGLAQSGRKVFGILGDGEAQEGQVYEMMNFASKHMLNNFIAFMDYNKVQLSDSLDNVMPLNVKEHFVASGWEVIEIDGHDFNSIWDGLGMAYNVKDKPILLLGHTIMGKGAGAMENDGHARKATWHGKAPSHEFAGEILSSISLSENEISLIEDFIPLIKWRPKKVDFVSHGVPMEGFDIGSPKVYPTTELTDCRSAYGNALKDLGDKNKQIVVFDADLFGSVKTEDFLKAHSDRFFQCGIAEQQMVSASGGASLNGVIPFCSTFGAFMTSRAKDQARVNDINQCNVKMVSTHCGLSVGEDGPTHQAIDDMGAFTPFFHTIVLEPSDPNHCDRIIRHVASHFGNYYVRMGRHKLPVLTKLDGSVFYDENYKFREGAFDLYRDGSDITVVASGPMVQIAQDVLDFFKGQVSVEIIIASGPSKIDLTMIKKSVLKTGRLVILEDQNVYTGIGSQILNGLYEVGVFVKAKRIGVKEYQLSGTPDELYDSAGIGREDLKEVILSLM